MTRPDELDPGFHVDLIALGARTGFRAEDLLYVWASETALRSDLVGDARTIAGLFRAWTTPSVMPNDVWDMLPGLPARAQLPYIEAAVLSPARRVLGRPALSTFEAYLAHAAPWLLRPDGRYSPLTPLRYGRSYPSAWPLDGFPAAATESGVACGAEGEGVRDAYAGTCMPLLRAGRLKGYVSLGDLAAFASRPFVARDVALARAIEGLDRERRALGLPEEDSWAADLRSQLAWGAPQETRAPSPREAAAAAPTGLRGRVLGLPAKWIFASALGLGILALGTRLHERTRPRP